MFRIISFIFFILAFYLNTVHAQERKTISIIGTTSGKSITATQPSVAAPKPSSKAPKNTVAPAPSVQQVLKGNMANSANISPNTTINQHTLPNTNSTTTLPSFSYEVNDSIWIKIENQQKYIAHTVKPGQAPMMICRFYGLTLNDLYFHNPETLNASLKVGQILRIPISNRAIRKYTGPDFDRSMYAPVYYSVNIGDNLYRIAKYYFAVPMDVIKMRNNMQDEYVYKDMCLHIGWIPRFGIPDTLQKYMGSSGALGEANFKLKSIYEANITELRDVKKMKNFEHEQAGLACWLKGEKFTTNVQLNVLYSGAPINSIVRLENEMNPNIFVYAKVVGPLPINEVTEGTIIMLSENVALALGGADERLPIKVQYLTAYPKKSVQGLNNNKPQTPIASPDNQQSKL